ncbi:MAG TPA: phosphomannomutase, partial [Chromatiales bacterium]|nr:phosphomannomutase [Chromatiales bacterium]
MLDPARLRHAYDLRGRVGLDLVPDDFRRLGRAIARRLRAEDGRALVVAHDGRLSSPELAQALVADVLAGGVDVLDIGLAPSPLAYFAERHLGAGGAAIVTASHNPADWNGLKLVLGGAVVFGEQ